MGATLIDKLWDAHAITTREDGATLLWIDRHLLHEGSFLAFDQLAGRGGRVAHPELTFGFADHYVPTRDRARGARQSGDSRGWSAAGGQYPKRAGIRLIGLDDPRQGHRACRRAGAGTDAAGTDYRLRRQPHLDAWRLWRLRLRDRRLGSRACPDDPDALAEAAEAHAHHDRRRVGARAVGQGSRAER